MSKIFETKLGRAYNFNCFDVMATMPDGCVDMILADLPYGTTACKWDTVIPFEPMWKEFHRIAKPNAAIVLTATQPFSSALVMSNPKAFKYEWIWKKSKVSGFTNAKNKPLNTTETILVFSLGTCANLSPNRMNYFPQGLVASGKICKNKERSGSDTVGNRPSRKGEYLQEFTGYPKNMIELPHDSKTFHPTQKPVALFEYLIKTYTNEGELVFDPTAGSLTTGVAAENLGRRWVCCEMDTEHGYFEKGVARF